MPVSSVLSVLSKGVEPKIAGGAPSRAARSTSAAPDLDAFEERAAIMEADGGLPREAAERLAAEATGFAAPSDLWAAVAEGWRRDLDALARREADPRGRDMLGCALRFVAEGWAAKAAALGWPELELFGADPCAPWARFDRLGAAFLPFAVRAATAERILFAPSLPRWRCARADGAALEWEAGR